MGSGASMSELRCGTKATSGCELSYVRLTTSSDVSRAMNTAVCVFGYVMTSRSAMSGNVIDLAS